MVRHTICGHPVRVIYEEHLVEGPRGLHSDLCSPTWITGRCAAPAYSEREYSECIFPRSTLVRYDYLVTNIGDLFHSLFAERSARRRHGGR